MPVFPSESNYPFEEDSTSDDEGEVKISGRSRFSNDEPEDYRGKENNISIHINDNDEDEDEYEYEHSDTLPKPRPNPFDLGDADDVPVHPSRRYIQQSASSRISMDGKVIQFSHAGDANDNEFQRDLNHNESPTLEYDQLDCSVATPCTMNTRIRDDYQDRAMIASSDGSEDSSNNGCCVQMIKNNMLNAHQISLCVVKSAPCFGLWCYTNKNELQSSASSDRFILARLNSLSFFFATLQLAACVWLLVILFVKGDVNNDGSDDFNSEVHLWNNNGEVLFIGCIALVLMIVCLTLVPIIKETNYVGALRVLWLLLWILPIECFLNISAFDYHHTTSIWVDHYWNNAQMWWFRKVSCLPGTSQSLCMVPINGGPYYATENAWCTSNYNATTCTEIRDEAQEETKFLLLIFYRALASWGCVYILLMLLIIKSLERIISKPMVQKSRELNVVVWLTFPVFCTALFGSLFLFAPYSYQVKFNGQRWIGYLYMITSSLFLIALFLGWFLSAFSIRSNVDKNNKRNAVLFLIMVLFLNAALLVSIFAISISWSYHLELTGFDRATLACNMKNSQCTGCNDVVTENSCPEWSSEDIRSIMRRQLKQSATLAVIFLLYDLNVMIHGLHLRKHLIMYQIDYV